MRVRKRRLRCQWAACSAGSTRAKAAGSRPSPCISSRRSARLSARSKAAVPAARCGSASARAATRRASSSLRRSAGTAAGRSGPSGSSASSARVRMRGRRRAGPSAKTAASARAARRVLSQNLDAGHGLGGLAGEAGVEAGGERAGEVDAGGEREDAGGVGGREDHRRQLGLGEGDPLRAADVGPAAGVDDAAEPAAGEEGVPDRVEREGLGVEAGERGGVDDLGAGVDEGRGGGVGAAAEAGPTRKKSPGPAWPVAAARGTRERRAPSPAPGGGEGGERVRAGPDHVGVEREDGAGAEEREGALQAAAGLEERGLVGDQRRRGRCGRGGPASARRGRGC